MTNVFIIHGSNGSIDTHWYKWLKKKLEEENVKVFLPQFPVGEKLQFLNNWLNTLKPLEKDLDGSIMIGHSLGVPFIIDVLNQWQHKIKAAFLVSGFTGHLEAEGEFNLDDFANKDFDWKKIKNNCKKFYVIHADNDPYIPLERAEELARKLGVKVLIVKGGEHFQEQSGYKKFEFLLEKVNGEL